VTSVHQAPQTLIQRGFAPSPGPGRMLRRPRREPRCASRPARHRQGNVPGDRRPLAPREGAGVARCL